jgi:predicted DNA-binding transcriptional regulator YafY
MGRRPEKYSQAERLALMIRTLASRACTIKDLAKDLEITRRQVYRDLARIEEEGHPLVQSDGAGERTWQLPLGYKGLPPITVSHYELMSLYLAKSHIAYLNGTPFLDDLDGLIKKIEAGLPQRTINHLERIVKAFLPIQRPTRQYGAKKEVLTELRKALLLQQTVVMHHLKPDYDEPTPHTVDPYILLLYQNGLYLLGYSHRAKALRMFAVERIQKMELTEDRFEIPSDFSPENLGRNRFGIIEEPPQEVQIRFSKDVAYLIKERQWHPTQRIKALKNGDVILTMQAGGLDEITSWVLSWGAKAKVLVPPALAEAVLVQLSAAQKLYSRKTR